jgi:DNA-binding NarL/FixJ family response regulator
MSMTNGTEAVGAAGAPATRVLLVDDHEMVAHGLAAALGSEPDLEVVGAASSVAECVRMTADLRPDVVIMDLHLGDGDGIDATRQVRRIHPPASVVMLTGQPDDRILGEALAAGCSGLVAKQGRLDELLLAIRSAKTGGATIPRDMVASLVRPTPKDDGVRLSAREREVLGLLADGEGTSDIAERLGLSLHTTRNHVRNLMTKLGAHSRLEAVLLAARAGLVDLPEHV